MGTQTNDDDGEKYDGWAGTDGRTCRGGDDEGRLTDDDDRREVGRRMGSILEIEQPDFDKNFTTDALVKQSKPRKAA
ncbi:hypothetical protein KIN20_036849 [Parelaphostrongylus tenuis]|uniref:Uncharacterized protein n=1 Tax=Parelaphostrongylus tenuis TaxID=148309 RepID=A0AAD5RDY6_PARTN|nr:hypothetical protein KIN20_036849 [Parelaphostrongylus tenuis]